MRILIFYDVRGWAWWHKARALQHYLEPKYEVTIAPHSQRSDPANYDFIILFGDYMLDMHPELPPEKLLLGLSNNGPRYVRKFHQAFEQKRILAGFANSCLGYEQIECAGTVFLCENGVDTEFFKPTSSPPLNFSICWVGNPNSDVEKGIDLITEACRITDTRLNLQVWDASKGDTSGVAPQEFLRDAIYWRSKAFICASLYDGTPNPALEAMACGLPVISTRVGNMPEIINPGQNGLLVKRTVEDISTAIEVIRKSDLAAMSKAARASVDPDWSWRQKALNYDEMLQELWAEGKSPR